MPHAHTQHNKVVIMLPNSWLVYSILLNNNKTQFRGGPKVLLGFWTTFIWALAAARIWPFIRDKYKKVCGEQVISVARPETLPLLCPSSSIWAGRPGATIVFFSRLHGSLNIPYTWQRPAMLLQYGRMDDAHHHGWLDSQKDGLVCKKKKKKKEPVMTEKAFMLPECFARRWWQGLPGWERNISPSSSFLSEKKKKNFMNVPLVLCSGFSAKKGCRRRRPMYKSDYKTPRERKSVLDTQIDPMTGAYKVNIAWRHSLSLSLSLEGLVN